MSAGPRVVIIGAGIVGCALADELTARGWRPGAAFRPRPGPPAGVPADRGSGQVMMGSEPVYAGGTPAGYVTSAAFGYTIGASIAYAWLPAAVSAPGNAVEIGYFGERVPAVVAAEPLFDPDMTRLRG